ncbi:MAG: hypothetical protein L3J11_10340 [Draconibacterium sp.]|nr:hypothetical protein [Draconibacterium sp.]
MDRKAIERIISKERLKPYLKFHSCNFEKAVAHYKANIEVSESFYPLLSILEIGLQNNIDNQLKQRFNDEIWFENSSFIKIVSRFQIDKVSEARNNILRDRKTITSGKIISELSFGFWASLLDSKFEKSLWKNIRLAFPNYPKNIRKRKTMSSNLHNSQIILFRSQTALNKENARFSFLKITKAISASLNSVLPFILCILTSHNENS